MDQKKIGKFLKELRKEKGVTQEQFAEVLGISLSLVTCSGMSGKKLEF